MDLGRDAFAIVYDPSRVNVAAMMAAISGLGYTSEEASADRPVKHAKANPGKTIPEPIAGAMAEARARKQLLFIDFHAPWCVSCKVLQAKVLADGQVSAVLERFFTLKVDSDEHVAASERFHVIGLPTLVVLDQNGAVVYRHEGMIDAATLARDLALLEETVDQ